MRVARLLFLFSGILVILGDVGPAMAHGTVPPQEVEVASGRILIKVWHPRRPPP